ncbi:NAD(P)-dependent alcohol dehydrogenase [Streptomyces griseofuscus]|uniref:NAD(P)-dependent alcohol dehydrogenase n=1 Tax=Streptomyces TaxID=1883 RepID=UPI00081EA3BF|nr:MULTISPECIES: NAD(P)-dependent alcohol dehydrogenase [unclassified Streptomyces]MYQ94115.1 zinc-binding dehydrogenase [Streptomyces sp. SID4946]SCF86751.1 Threonine dehydrogenase [Streptomyces sp. DconLS]SCG05367.1 Threonine dehydrogenase [Streptomyces sp. LamerLS-31b]
MKAFVMKEIGSVGFMDKPVPEPGPTDAVVRTTKALICTSDSHTVQGGIGPRTNLTLGHEGVGVVHAVGDEVRDFRPGDRVLVGAITPDWGDLAAQNGYPSQSGGALGGFKFANLKDGVFAEYFHVSGADANLARIPDDIPDDVAVYCADMLSTGFMGAEHGAIPIGGTVAVLAQGPVGLMATAGARLRGAGLVIGVESVPSRQELARFYGADVIVDFSKEDVVERIHELTDGQGVDTAIEALGADVTFQTAVKVTKPGGTISVIGYFGQGEFVHIPRVEWGVGMADKTIATGLCPGGRLRMERLLRVVANKRVDPTRLTTHRFPFSEMERAFEVSDKKLEDTVKVLVSFDE